ncbi:MAG: DUF4384 domain-containing protein [Pseudomonadota bacterium]
MIHANLTRVVVLLTTLLLHGCTINVYQQNPPAGYLADNTDAQDSFNQPVTVNANAIMSISTTPATQLASADDPIALEVTVNVDAYVSCFYQQDNNPIIKLFPNRVIPLYRLAPGQLLQIPGANGFRVHSPQAQTSERYMCLASQEDVTPDLPLEIQSSAYQPLTVDNFDQLFQIFRNSTRENLIARVLEVPIQPPAPLTRSLSLQAMY